HLIVLSPYPTLFCASSVLLLVLSIIYIIRRSPVKQDPLFNKTLQFVWLLTIVHAGFSIFSGPIVMRYQLFPQAFIFTLLVLLTGKLFLRTAR
ncbi:MAG TPA: hypothetical protein VL307_16775, partial [Chitinophagaceae bacterium]|nr:hypothetical protein [Chitinophagaceae bacterium]